MRTHAGPFERTSYSLHAHMPDAFQTGLRAEPRSRSRADRLLSASAGIVAACALLVSVYQTYIMRQQQRMSAWPYVTQGNTGSDSTYGRLVSNVGLGPALVRSMTVDVAGLRVHTWAEFLDRTTGLDSAGVQRTFGGHLVTSSVRRGMVILPGTSVELLRYRGPEHDFVRGAVADAKRVRVRICYCSLYAECWMSDTADEAPEPSPVRACPDRAREEFKS